MNKASFLLRKLKERDGSADPVLYILFILAFVAVMVTALTTVAWLFAAKQHGINTMIVAARQAEAAAVSNPELALGQGDLNPEVATATFNQVFQQRIGWPSNTYQIETVTVYNQSQAGSPLPVGLSGNVPGPSLYVDAQFKVSIIPFWGGSSGLEVTIPVQVLVAPNRYNHPGQTWVGG